MTLYQTVFNCSQQSVLFRAANQQNISLELTLFPTPYNPQRRNRVSFLVTTEAKPLARFIQIWSFGRTVGKRSARKLRYDIYIYIL